MKSFKEYLSESKKTYTFKVKVAGDFTTEQESKLKTLLDRYEVKGFKKATKTPVQQLPLDFPQVKNCEVSIFEVTLDYPSTQFELTEYLAHNLGIGKDRLVVRSPNEPSEEYQEPKTINKEARLLDPDMKEAESVKAEDYYGDAYNSKFLKELNDVLKLQRRERGEEIPEAKGNENVAAGKAKFNTDSAANNNSPIKQAADPRK